MVSLEAFTAYTRRQFRSGCTITRPGAGEPVWNGTEYVTPTVNVYTGPCLLQPVEANTRVVQAGDRAVSLGTYRLQVPADVTARVDDTVEMTESADGLAVGVDLRVIDVPKGDLTTVRTLVVEEQT